MGEEEDATTVDMELGRGFTGDIIPHRSDRRKNRYRRIAAEKEKTAHERAVVYALSSLAAELTRLYHTGLWLAA